MSIADADNVDFRGTNEGSKLSYYNALWGFNTLVNNSEYGTSGFLAKPNGAIFKELMFPSEFIYIGTGGFWWTSTVTNGGVMGDYRNLDYNNSGVKRQGIFVDCGFAVRCVMD